ncbi:MAG: chorismate lyase [Pseudomonadales bacterium]|nr:chorismate lyase [Pseudomonadales bacterium]
MRRTEPHKPTFLLQRPPAPLQQWLGDCTSLTQRLQQLSHQQFRVSILTQHWAKPRLAEAQRLGIPAHERALIREVILYGCEQPWVYARSVLPQRTLSGKLRFLRQWDSRPLGALLFGNPHIQREPPRIHRWAHASLPATLPVTWQTAEMPTLLWGRSSVFRHHQQRLLVSETFLPALVNAILSPP